MVIAYNYFYSSVEFIISGISLLKKLHSEVMVMELLYSTQSQTLPTFISAGTFIKDHKWHHKERTIDSYELILPLRGVLPLQIEETKYLVKPGALLVVPPNVIHKGFKETTDIIQFDWIHFNVPTLKSENLTSLKKHLDDYPVVLPQYAQNLSINRIHILSNQLLDINQKKVDHRYLDSLLSCILYEISDQVKQLVVNNNENSTELQRVREWIRIHSSESINLERISDFFCYNKSYLSRIYKEKFNSTITSDVERFRLEKAKSLLVETSYTVEEVSTYVGYNDSKYFMRVFKKNVGMTPSQYRHMFYQRHYNQR